MHPLFDLALLLTALATPSTRLAALERGYLAGLFRAKPHLADYMGDHRFAGQLADLSPRGLRRRIGELEAQRSGLAAIDPAALTRDEQIDAAILRDGIALELLELTEIREWTWSPRLVDSFVWYDPREMIASRLSGLVHGSWGTEDTRRRAATEQLRALPRWLGERRRALGQVSELHLEQERQENRGRIRFFQTELAEFTRAHPQSEAARRAALRALRSYQRFMETELPPRATRSWRLGPELYRKKFPLALQTDLAPDELVRLARRDFAAARAELYQLARRLHGQLWPSEPPPAADAPSRPQAEVIARVRDETARDHPAADALVKAHADQLTRLRAFVEARGLVTLPPPDTLSVEVMPDFKRSGAGAEYLAPGALDRSAPFHGTYYVDPVDPTWSPEKVESYLRANNEYEIALTAAHEAIPGHHVQAWWSHRRPNPLRDTLWSGPFAEGWAMYGEALLAQNGFGGDQNDRYRFHELLGRMIVCANAILDVGLQGGAMTDQEALRFMVEDGFQETAQAERKLLRAKLESTQLPQYFLGWTEIVRLERGARDAGGFEQRRFDEELLAHGTIAVKYLRRDVLGGR